MEKNNKIVFGIIAAVFLVAFVLEGAGDITGAHRIDVTKSKADLQITYVDITAEDITVTIYNAGYKTRENFVVGLYGKTTDGYWETIGSMHVYEILSGKSKDVTYTWDEGLESDKIKVVLDRDNKVVEEDKENNIRCFSSRDNTKIQC